MGGAKSQVSAALVFTMMLSSQVQSAEGPSWPEMFWHLLKRARELAGQVLEVKGRGNLLAITNASFARVRGEETISLLDLIQQQTGCSQGAKNLIALRSAPDRPLYLFFFNREREEAAYLELKPEVDWREWMGEDRGEIFSRVTLAELPVEDILADPAKWEKRFQAEKMFGGDEIRLASISLLWREGLPQELIKALEIHDHICPGLLSGYFLVRFLLDQLSPHRDADYFVVSSPVWCKDDLVQSVLNVTVGKENLIVFPLSDSEKEHLADPNAAGIFFQRHRRMGGAKGIVLGFDWRRMAEDARLEGDWYSWGSRLRLALFMARHREEYARYVYTIKRLQLEPGEELKGYFPMGDNPWKRVGLWRD